MRVLTFPSELHQSTRAAILPAFLTLPECGFRLSPLRSYPLLPISNFSFPIPKMSLRSSIFEEFAGDLEYHRRRAIPFLILATADFSLRPHAALLRSNAERMGEPMIQVQLKLKLTKRQESTLNGWLWNLTGLYNWAIRKIELDARDRIYHSEFEMKAMLNGHSKRMGNTLHILRGTVATAHLAWTRCFKKIAKRPKLKGQRK